MKPKKLRTWMSSPMEKKALPNSFVNMMPDTKWHMPKGPDKRQVIVTNPWFGAFILVGPASGKTDHARLTYLQDGKQIYSEVIPFQGWQKLGVDCHEFMIHSKRHYGKWTNRVAAILRRIFPPKQTT